MTLEWTKPDYLGIKWDTGPNRPASPLTEISRDEFLKAFFCYPWGLDGLNFGGSASLPDADHDDRSAWYRWQYFFFHRQALAIATKAGDKPDGSECYLSPEKYELGHDVKFYRLGCLHPNMQHGSPRMHESTSACPDCGFSASYDSSG